MAKLTKEGWYKAREKHFQKILDDEKPFWNFDYKFLLNKFFNLNSAILEAEEGVDELTECIKENDYYSYIFKGQSKSKLKSLRKKYGRNYRHFRGFSHFSYQDLAKMAFYGRLTQLKQEGRNYIGNAYHYFTIKIHTGQEFNFFLEDIETNIEKDQQSWINKKIHGMTGDTYGAIIEIVELVILISAYFINLNLYG